MFTLGVALTQSTETRTVDDVAFETAEAHPERVWWILAPNPFVIVADAAPRAVAPDSGAVRLDPLGAIGEVARSMRTPDPTVVDEAGNVRPAEAPVWPYGLAVNVVIGVGAIVITTRRLNTPYGVLSRAVRVA